MMLMEPIAVASWLSSAGGLRGGTPLGLGAVATAAVLPGSVTLLGAFLAGLLSFLSPCVLPLTPAYVARLVGPAVWESRELERSARASLRATTTRHAAAFVAGFTTAFIALGATASQLVAFLTA